VRRERIWAGQQVTRLTVSLLVAAALATGCSNDEAPQASTELPSTSSTSAEPTPELPPLGPADFPVPDEARTQDEAGAETFLRYYIDLINRQQAIPAGGPLRDLGPACEDCLRVARQYDEVANAGQKVDGGQLFITTEPGIKVTDGEARISFIVRVAAIKLVGPSGETVANSTFPAQPRIPSGALLTWSSGKQSWLMRTLTIE
jgi:hypothetical protein